MKKHLIISKFIVALFFVNFFAQISVQAQSDVFRHITPRDGLPSGFIWTMTQDSKGFIWFGTNNGLGKHDGYSTKIYRSDSQDSTTISGGIVYDIIEYDKNTFFVATESGLNLFNPATEVFNHFSVPDSLPDLAVIRDLLLLDEHSMWVAAGTGLFHVDPTTLTDENPIVEFFEVPGLSDSQAANLTALAADSVDNLWVGSDSTLFKFNLDTKNFVDIGPVEDDAARILEGNIWSMLFTSGNDLLITSTTGLAILQESENVIKEVKQLGVFDTQDLRGASFQAMMEDSNGKIWLSTGLMGAIHWDPVTGEIVSYRSSSENNNTIASDDVHYAFEDREGNIWFGYHFVGASVMYSYSWNYETYTPFPELPSIDLKNTITNAQMDENGTLWATTPEGLIRDLGGVNQEFFYFDKSAHESIGENQALQVIYQIHGNKVYLGSLGPGFQSGFIVFDSEKEGDPFDLLQVPGGLQGTPGTGVKHEGIFYAGIYNANSFIQIDLNSEEVELIDLPVQGEYPNPSLSVSAPHFIYENELYTGAYFLNTPDGSKVEWFIINLETGEIRSQNLEIDFPMVNLQPPLVSSYETGVIYLSTSNGLIRVDHLENSYTVLFEDDMSLLREGSMLMTEDEEGYIWLNNSTGLTRVDLLTESIEYYEVPSEEYTPLRAFPTTLPDGEIIFPGNGTYIRFNPADLSSTQPAGETLITSLQAGTEVFELVYNAVEPVVESDQNTLTFNFIGLDLRNPASIHYRYRILGSESEQWTQLGTQRSVFIPNLPAGDYTFEVQSGSQFGTFDGQSASLSFSVLPPWWNTIPAYFMYLLLFGGLVFGLDRFQRRRLIQKERERTREKELKQAKEIEKAYENLKAAQEQLVQQEKLASLGQLTAGIAHEIKNPLNFVNNFSDVSLELIDEALKELRQISENSHAAETAAILEDIKSNLSKIHEHGTRADGIVKSMLMHSRGGSGKMEPVNLNDFVQEYVNLAFHGMRAGKEPINVDIDMQLGENVGNVPLIAEDFSRVIVNLCNNGFDAMREKLSAVSSQQSSYQPKLTVRTKSTNGNILIEIEDNGPGIPDDIKDNILQPFFTTKKGTQGTGLGLSITNDIVKAHGMEMKIESEPGRTVFRIRQK